MNNTICLITPPSIFLLDERVFLTLGILRVAACLEREGYTVEMLDLSGIENYETAVSNHSSYSKAKVFGITATTPQMPAATKIVQAIRAARPDARIILGGPHVTLVNAALKRERKIGLHGRATRAFTKLMEMFDVLVCGDGEEAIFPAIQPDSPKVVDADDPKSAMFLTNERLNELPWPARHLVDVDSYHYNIEGERSLSLVAQLGCPFASLTGDALIFTDQGFEQLDCLVHGMGESETCVHGATIRKHELDRRVTTHLGNHAATSIIAEGRRQVFRVTTENGMELKATAEHPFLVMVNGKFIWKKVSELKKWDWLVQKTPEHVWPVKNLKLQRPSLPTIPPGGFPRRRTKLPTELDEELAWFVGFIIGDGCLPRDGRPEIHVCLTPDTEKRIKRIVKKAFGVRMDDYASSQTKKMRHGWIRSRAAYNFMVQSIGIDPFNKFHVPSVIRRSPRSVAQAFIDGLMDADGHSPKDGKRPYLVTASWSLAREVAALTLLLGFVPNIQTVKRRPGHHYRVGQLHNDRIPTTSALYHSDKSGLWFWRSPRKKNTFCGVRRMTLTKSGLKHPLDKPGLHYVRVESVRKCGIEPVYDLHVPKAHSFLADGLIVHNCGFCGGRESPMLRRIRMRSTENVIAEIRHLHTTYGVRGTQFYDDELNVNTQMIPLMNGIAGLGNELGVEWKLRGFIKSQLFTDQQAEAMYRAGFRWILVGFESGSERILENINKKATRDENTRCVQIARRHGLKVKALMSMGHPGETEQTVMDTHDWLLEMKPEDFDMTIITTYPGTPYYDYAVKNKEEENVWTYTYPKTGDKLHAYEVDFTQTADYYKGNPEGGYHSYVYTDSLSAQELVRLRDGLEREVRAKLNIPFNPSTAAVRYEHSMGQSGLPSNILRKSQCA